jgi:hypothetical protein
MKRRNKAEMLQYRVWIVHHEPFQPANWHAIPPSAVAVEPAEPEAMTEPHARRYVEAFNRAAFGRRRRLWAVAVPVTVFYDGDPRPGQRLAMG